MSITSENEKKQNEHNSQVKPCLDEEPIDLDSIKLKFGWDELYNHYVPLIFRRGEKYCSVRMVEDIMLNNYLNKVHPDLYNCINIKSYNATVAESEILNEINIQHSDSAFGKKLFMPGDLIVPLRIVDNFYKFLQVCYTKLKDGIFKYTDICGFIHINNTSVVPYIVKNNEKYLPTFYFELLTDKLKLKTIEVNNLDLWFLKFCCQIQEIRNELYEQDSCTVINLDCIKNNFPPDTKFENYFPTNISKLQLLLKDWGKQEPRPIGNWIRTPVEGSTLRRAPSLTLINNINQITQIPLPLFQNTDQTQDQSKNLHSNLVQISKATSTTTSALQLSNTVPENHKTPRPSLFQALALPPPPTNEIMNRRFSTKSETQKVDKSLHFRNNNNNNNNNNNLQYRNSHVQTSKSKKTVQCTMQRTLIDDKLISCLSIRRYNSHQLFASVYEIMKIFFNHTTTEKLQEVARALKIELLQCNNIQKKILKENNLCTQENDCFLLIRASDVKQLLPQMKYMMINNQVTEEPPAKRQCIYEVP